MEIISPSRRSFLTGLSAIICAPAIVRASSLMPINSKMLADEVGVIGRKTLPFKAGGGILYHELRAITRKAFVPNLYVQLYDSNPLLYEWTHGHS